MCVDKLSPCCQNCNRGKNEVVQLELNGSILFVSAAGWEEQGGARRVDVHLPSLSPEEEEVAAEVSAGADTDSSTSDVF